MKLSKTVSTVSQLVSAELKFHSTQRDVHGKTWAFSESPTLGSNVVVLNSGSSSFFYPESTKKTGITLHHTVGHLGGDIATLSKPNHHVSTSFVVSRSGKAYQLFDPTKWSYHLGTQPGTLWTNTAASKGSIGIELSNFGPLTLSGDKLFDVYGYFYCHLDDSSEYHFCSESWRGYSYFAAYTDAQYRCLDSLLLKLCREFKIPHSFLPVASRLDFTKKIPSVGIWAHCNVRSDKTDISPAFNWSRIQGR